MSGAGSRRGTQDKASSTGTGRSQHLGTAPQIEMFSPFDTHNLEATIFEVLHSGERRFVPVVIPPIPILGSRKSKTRTAMPPKRAVNTNCGWNKGYYPKYNITYRGLLRRVLKRRLGITGGNSTPNRQFRPTSHRNRN
jgi:hypothetical protein